MNGIIGWRNLKTGRLSDAEGHPGKGWEPVYGNVPGVSLDTLRAQGFFDGVTIETQRRVARELDLPMTTQTDRDFWLLEHAARITETTTGHAHAAVNAMARGPVRDRAKDAVERQKEITARFIVFAGTVSPFVYEYDPDMPEAQLRAWAAGVVSALKGE